MPAMITHFKKLLISLLISDLKFAKSSLVAMVLIIDPKVYFFKTSITIVKVAAT
jgi:hypothetical protein